MQLSKPQLARFWRLWSRAEREALPASATKEERAELRRRTIREACGCESLTLVKRGAEYDRLMVATALLANDYEEAAHFSIGNERRLAKLMVECARQIGEIVGAPHGWDYCRVTLAQANLPSSWEDVPEELLGATLAMLDTHRRRLLRREVAGDRGPLAFTPRRRYFRGPNGLLYHHDAPMVEPAKALCTATA